MLALIPAPWNAVALVAIGVLGKILHSRIANPTPGPAPAPEPETPLLDALLAALRAKHTKPAAPANPDIGPDKVAQLVGLLGDDKPK